MTSHHNTQRKSDGISNNSDLLIKLKSEHGLTYREIANRVGVDEATISRVANAKQEPSGQLLEALKMLNELLDLKSDSPWPNPESKRRAQSFAASLRHLFATRCLESGVDVKTVASWLGHKDGGALLLKRYAHLRDHHSQKMARKVKF